MGMAHNFCMRLFLFGTTLPEVLDWPLSLTFIYTFTSNNVNVHSYPNTSALNYNLFHGGCCAITKLKDSAEPPPSLFSSAMQ